MKLLSRVWLSAIPWTVAYQAPPSMGFSRQEYWSELPFSSPGDLPKPGIRPRSPSLQAAALPSEPPGKPQGKDLTRKKQEQRQVSEFSSPPWSHALPHGIILFRLLCALLQACDLYSALSISFLFFPSPWGWGPWVVAFVSFIIPNAILSTCSSSS